MGSISGAFALIAFIGGLVCWRLRTALIVGAVPVLLYLALVAIGLWSTLPDTDLGYMLGYLIGACLVILLFAIIGYYLRPPGSLHAAGNRSFSCLSR
jgi:hypothetical protein